jgi:hypothetical protein
MYPGYTKNICQYIIAQTIFVLRLLANKTTSKESDILDGKNVPRVRADWQATGRFAKRK